MANSEEEEAEDASGALRPSSKSRKLSPPSTSMRHSAREKKPVQLPDLGYVDRSRGKKLPKGGAYEAAKKCERVLAQLCKHPCIGPFLTPVDVPGYGLVIKEPMDLGTVGNKLRGGEYGSPGEFIHDICKIWTNSWAYNEPGSDIFIATTEMSNFFENLLRELSDPQFTCPKPALPQLKKRPSRGTAVRKATSPELGPAGGVATSVTGAHGGPPSASVTSPVKSLSDKPMTIQEKAQLKQNLMKLPQEKLQGVMDIARQSDSGKQTDDVFEFDIDTLPTNACRELDRYVKKNMVSGHKLKTPIPKAERKPSVRKGNHQVSASSAPRNPDPRPERDHDHDPDSEVESKPPQSQLTLEQPIALARSNPDGYADVEEEDASSSDQKSKKQFPPTHQRQNQSKRDAEAEAEAEEKARLQKGPEADTMQAMALGPAHEHTVPPRLLDGYASNPNMPIAAPPPTRARGPEAEVEVATGQRPPKARSTTIASPP
jgi:hypothetical protein